MKIKSIKMYGQSKQDGAPSIDNPKEIKSTEISEIADTKNYIDNKITSISTALMKGV